MQLIKVTTTYTSFIVLDTGKGSEVDFLTGAAKKFKRQM
jgi:hypothetical protein